MQGEISAFEKLMREIEMEQEESEAQAHYKHGR